MSRFLVRLVRLNKKLGIFGRGRHLVSLDLSGLGKLLLHRAAGFALRSLPCYVIAWLKII